MNFDRPNEFGNGADCNSAPGPCVFHPGGGGATAVTAPPEIMQDGLQGEWIFTSEYAIENIGTTAAANSANDIIAFLPGIKTSICARLNTELGVTSDPSTTLSDAAGQDDDQDGVPDVGIALANIPATTNNMYSSPSSNLGISGTDAQTASQELGNAFAGQPFGCADFDSTADDPDDGDLVYYHVLVER